MPLPRRLLAVLAVAMVLFTLASAPHGAVAASCSGNSHALTLSGGAAAPGSGTTATKFMFSVTYADNDGCAPDRIVVAVVGVGTFALSHVAGGLQSGATFAHGMTLPAGRWAYRFEASSGSGAGKRQAKLLQVTPAKVLVTKPVADPTPRPIATAAPTPRRTAAPTKAPPSPGASVAPAATPVATEPGPTPTGVASTLGPTRAPSVTARTPPDPGLPIAVLKLVVSSTGTIGGILLFVALSGRWLRPASGAELLPVSKRRRDDDPPAASEPGT